MPDQHPSFEPFESAKATDSARADAFAAYLASRNEPAPALAEAHTIIVIGKHRYYNLFSAQLVSCGRSSSGEPKAPFTILNPVDLVWRTEKLEEVKFYNAVTKFQNFYEKSPADFAGLQALVQNPLRYPFYLHDSQVSEKITPRAIAPVQVSQPQLDYKIRVGLQEDVFSVTSDLFISGAYYNLSRIGIRFDYFLVEGDNWYLPPKPALPPIIAYFQRQDNDLRLSHDAFLPFQQQVLSEMENHVPVAHTYQKPAARRKKSSSNHLPEKLLYLFDMENYVLLHPFMRYGESEVSVFSQKQLYAQDSKGKVITVNRDDRAEEAFIALLVQQHSTFWEQLENPWEYFYLHKSRFMAEEWFLEAFDTLREQGVRIYGFNDIKGNKLNQHKARISIQVASGLNWFNANVEVRFGRKKAPLKQLHKSVANKSKYVLLDDGTMGVIPEGWLQRFEGYFGTGEVSDDSIRIPKTNFEVLSELYEVHMLDEEVQQELHRYHAQLSGLTNIAPVPVPADLQATLRPYQLQGLSWLNTLDDFGFGGCLADDMGLGKTVQIIAFMLLLREKREKQTHLLVLPTSLIHNWQEELQRFAPKLQAHVHHGPDRRKTTAPFAEQDVIITTYNTLVSDIPFLKKFLFGNVFLDESQFIKNPNSQRYKAARLLQARNRIVLSGTPLENNTFDIYAQFSFACPGLLGSLRYFRHTYAASIDKFKDRRSARDLQQKISPFLLRRTKDEVARELPDKVETVLYCEMGEEQRKIYDAYEREFRDYISASDEEEIKKKPMHVLRGITKLRQICNLPLLTGDDKIFGSASAKIEMLLQQIRNVSRHHKVLVFSQFVSMLELIKQELVKEEIKFSWLTGSTSNRGEVVRQFQEDVETRVFLVSLKAGGTGLNLTAADYVFLVDPWWNPAVENQAIDRSYRIGQEKKVIAVRLICPDTVEEKIQILQQTKASLATDLVSTENSFFQSLTKDDWLRLTSRGRVYPCPIIPEPNNCENFVPANQPMGYAV